MRLASLVAVKGGDGYEYLLPIHMRSRGPHCEHQRDCDHCKRILERSKYNSEHTNKIYNDNLLKKHLQKAIYEILFAPISIFILIVFCGSYIFGSLRESNPSSKIIFAVIISFLYKTTQDFSISFFISYNLPLIIGVILPSTVVGLIAINLYKKI